MKYEEIPDQQKRICIACSSDSKRYKTNYTQQMPIGVEFHSGSNGSFIQWKWECLECHKVQS